MASATCTGFLLFVCFQMSLLLVVTAQSNCTISANITNTNTTICGTNTTLSNDTIAGGINDTSIPCRLFTCSSADCSNVSKNANNTFCSGSDRFCELRRTSTNGTVYTAVCSSSCFNSCANTSQSDCSINCCNGTNCINSTLNSLTSSPLIVTTVTASTTTATTTKATTTVPATTLTNGKKCQKQTCNGDTCYKDFTTVALCGSTQNFCMLKKTLSGTVASWAASCIEDCSKETVCSTSTTTCILECCNATTTASCLKLNGLVNIFNGATSLKSPVLLITFSVFLWLLSMGRSYG